MGRRQRPGIERIELIELIEPDEQGWDTAARSPLGSPAGRAGPTVAPARGQWWLAAAGLAAAFVAGAVAQRAASGDGRAVPPAPSTTVAPSSTSARDPVAEPPSATAAPPPEAAIAPSPLLVDVPNMIAVSVEVTDRAPNDSFSPPVVVYHHPLTGETLRLGDRPRSMPRAAFRVDLGDGLVGQEWSIGGVTTVVLEGSDPVRAVIGTADPGTLHRVLVTAANGGPAAGELTELGFVFRRSANIDGLWAGADMLTVIYAPIGDDRSLPWSDRPALTVSQLRHTGISEPWALVLPQRFDVPGGTAYGGYLDSQAVVGVQLADQVVVLRGNGLSLDQLVAAAATLRPARAGEWGEIQSGTRRRDLPAVFGVQSAIDSGVMLGGAPWATETLRDFAGVDSWSVQAGSRAAFSYLGINRVDRPVLVSTVVEGATAVLAVAPRDGVYQLRVLFGGVVQLDLPLRASTTDALDESGWQARSYVWSELGPWSAAIIDGTGAVVATLDPGR